MKSVYVVTMWSGGRPAKKWKTNERPQLMPAGTGVEFVNAATRLKVNVIGSISIEEFESGKEEIELGTANSQYYREKNANPPITDDSGPSEAPSNIKRIY